MKRIHLLLYDGVCGLCNRLNQFVLPRDRADKFRFAALQSGLGREMLSAYGKDPGDLNTFYVVVDYGTKSEQILARARAALFVLREIGGPWRAAQIFRLVPVSLLDKGYDVLARNRYRWFGRYETCLIPSASVRSKFLDTNES